jgi:hypothetical protein
LDAIAYPTFFTQFPATAINVLTQDTSKVRAYNFKLKASESISGVFNDSNAFVCNVILPNYATSISWVTSTNIADFTYLLGSSEIQKVAPSYTYLLANADVKFTSALGASTPSFITLVTQATGNPKISVVTSNVANVGIYPITYTVTDVFSGLSISQTFKVTVSCVQSIAVGAAMTPILYYINDPAITTNIPLF